MDVWEKDVWKLTSDEFRLEVKLRFSATWAIGILAAYVETRWIPSRAKNLHQDVTSFQKALCRLKPLHDCPCGQKGPFWLWSLCTQMPPEKYMQM